MRKRAGLARALALDPPVVVIDSPEAGLDPARAALLADLVALLHARRGGTYLVLTGNSRLAHRITDRVVVVSNRRIEAYPQ
jgi:ABC-type transporter Mla maintaining outer membrane lipid asymmetry ATPase subunit MlaF